MRDKIDIFTLKRLLTLKSQRHTIFITKRQAIDIVADLSAINRCDDPRAITLDIMVDIGRGKEALNEMRQ